MNQRGRDPGSRPHPGRWAATALVALAASSAAAFQNEPAGFGEARLGMSAEAAKRALPGLEPAAGIPPAGIAYYRLGGQKFRGLEPCALRFNFLDDRLYEIQFDCGREQRVADVLEREFGRPTLRESYGIFWYGQQVVLSLSPGSKVFGLSDRNLMQAAQQAVLRATASP